MLASLSGVTSKQMAGQDVQLTRSPQQLDPCVSRCIPMHLSPRTDTDSSPFRFKFSAKDSKNDNYCGLSNRNNPPNYHKGN